jgi:hypothetical protein
MNDCSANEEEEEKRRKGKFNSLDKLNRIKQKQ